MPIRPECRALYPPNWPELSRRVRFERAGGRCQRCRRPHLAQVRCLPDGRWFDETARTWRDWHGRPARWPDLIDAIHIRLTRVVLAATHLDNDPGNNRLANLKSLCQRCHMLQDRPFHLAQRWLTYRGRRALGDLFLGEYDARRRSPTRFAVVYRIWLAADRGRVASGSRSANPSGLSWGSRSRLTARGAAADLFAIAAEQG